MREIVSLFDAVLDQWFMIRIAVEDDVILIACGTVWKDRTGRFADGNTIRTSPIVGEADTLDQGSLIRTMNSTYLLGAPIGWQSAITN
jgi:hypothetical protein